MSADGKRAYHCCLNLQEKFSEPGVHSLSQSRMYNISLFCAIKGHLIHRFFDRHHDAELEMANLVSAQSLGVVKRLVLELEDGYRANGDEVAALITNDMEVVGGRYIPAHPIEKINF